MGSVMRRLRKTVNKGEHGDPVVPPVKKVQIRRAADRSILLGERLERKALYASGELPKCGGHERVGA